MLQCIIFSFGGMDGRNNVSCRRSYTRANILLSLYEGTNYIQNNIIIISRYRSIAAHSAAARHDAVGRAYIMHILCRREITVQIFNSCSTYNNNTNHNKTSAAQP